MNYIFFGNKSSADFKVFITDAGVYATPQREYEKISVPGRNGDVLIEQDRFPNVIHEYPCIIAEDFDENFKAFSAFILSQRGYLRLEDSFHPDEFYIATFKGIDSLKHTIGQKMGSFVLKFDRKPQRWLKSGEKSYTMSSNSFELKNPTPYDAKPLIKLTGPGTVDIYPVVVNAEHVSITVNVSGSYTGTDIDCDTEEAYYGLNSRNGAIVLNNGKFPSLVPGRNVISINGFSTCTIIPRWWTL